jgi:hypothetical protein
LATTSWRREPIAESADRNSFRFRGRWSPVRSAGFSVNNPPSAPPKCGKASPYRQVGRQKPRRG